jgi:tetratricopeptide (TPR) repeat protein
LAKKSDIAAIPNIENMFNRILYRGVVFFLLTFIGFSALAQPPKWTINLFDSIEKKPEKFTERKLGSEKMANKKFNFWRRFTQNNFTRYNYYFNANTKINGVLERAKANQNDDYSKLLAYYPYTLENTAAQKVELDSVIYKSTAGILLHDLRNDWIDDMYLLMGKAYFLRKNFDSAAATFQFIQYNLFPRNKDEDDNRVVGSKEFAAGNSISVANTEKQSLVKKITGKPPSRNDALVWLARTLIEQNELGDAAGLIQTLKNDPQLPPRLVNDLDDINAYWFFKQNVYDSASFYLEKGLTNAENKQDRARSEFLLAQLYELTGNFEKAAEYYGKSSVHTTVPMMDIYAQMNNAKMRRGNDPKELDKGIDNLVKLTKKDNFDVYRDILYYAAGDLAMLKPDTNQAINFFTKSYQLNQNNVTYKNKAFLQLADIAYQRKQYEQSFVFYDSLQSGDTSLSEETLANIQTRRNSLSKIVEQLFIINREDSVQRIAAMQEPDRSSFVKKLSKKLRKTRGLKEEDNNAAGGDMPITFSKDANAPTDLFASSNNAKGEWYFYNSSLKAKGFTEFKRRWGTRANADNWRRKSALQNATTTTAQQPSPLGNMNPDAVDEPTVDEPAKDDGGKSTMQYGKDKNGNLKSKSGNNSPDANNAQQEVQAEDISFEGLMAGLPLTPERLAESRHKLAVSSFTLGKLFQEELEDYGMAVDQYEKSLRRFPDSLYNGELYAGLVFCYTKLGNTAAANKYKNLLNTKMPGSDWSKKVKDPKNLSSSNQKDAVGTKRYEEIYLKFIEGRFADALSDKQKADSLYGKNYWTPQLLYIEAVYHVKEKNDSAAIETLKNIGELYPKSKLKPKADRMIDVLGRRKEIEQYLTDLKVTRAQEDSIEVDNTPIKVAPLKIVRNDSNLIKSTNTYDSLQTLARRGDSLRALARVQDSLRIIARRMDSLATAQKRYNDSLAAEGRRLDSLMRNAKIRDSIMALVRLNDSLKNAARINDSLQLIARRNDSLQLAALRASEAERNRPKITSGSYVFNPKSPHVVVMLLDKVDGTYINECKNAFTRYVNEFFRRDGLQVTRDAIDANTAMIVFNSFADANNASQFLYKVRKAAPDEVSWLPANKYSFILIDNENLDKLKTSKDLANYKALLSKAFPGQF